MESIELADGGILLYDDAFLPLDLAQHYFVELRDHSAWEQKPGVFGHLQPRLTASYGDEGIKRWGGSKKGWRWKVSDDQLAAVHEMRVADKPIAQIARVTSLSRPTE